MQLNIHFLRKHIQRKMICVYLGLFLISIFNFLIFIANDQSKGITAVNLAGRQRMLSQKIMNEALILSRTSTEQEHEKAIQNFISSIRIFSNSLDVLMTGGISDLGPVDSLRNNKSYNVIKELITFWNEYKKLCDIVYRMDQETAQFQNALNEMIPLSLKILENAHNLTESIEEETHEQAKRIWLFQLIGNVLVIFIIVSAFFTIIIPLFQRLDRITIAAERYAKEVSKRMPGEKSSEGRF